MPSASLKPDESEGSSYVYMTSKPARRVRRLLIVHSTDMVRSGCRKTYPVLLEREVRRRRRRRRRRRCWRW